MIDSEIKATYYADDAKSKKLKAFNKNHSTILLREIRCMLTVDDKIVK